MTRRWHCLSLAGAVLLLAGCNTDLMSPLRPHASSATARATAAMSLYASVQNAGSIALSWIDVARNESGWEVHRSTSGAGGPFVLLASLPANTVVHVDGGLTPQTQYCYRVRSFRAKGPNVTPEAFSEVVCATTFAAPAAPSALAAVPNSSVVQLTWTDNAADETGVRVERAPAVDGAWTGIANLPPNATAFTDYGRPLEQMVCYRVTALGQYGSAPGVIGCTVPPATPVNASATTTGTASIDVTWTDASAYEDGYQVERSDDGYSPAIVATLPAGATSFHDATITPDQRYLYRVRAMKDGGFSSYSSYAVGLTVTGPPQTPGLQVYSQGSTTAWVHWGVSATTTSVRVDRSADGASGWEEVAVVNLSEADSFYDGNRASEVSVCYRVFASNAFGESAASNVDCTIPLAGPTDLVLTTTEPGGYTATWTDNSSHEEGYLVTVYYCYDAYYCEYYYDIWLESNATSVATGPYEYPAEIRACSNDGCSDYATWATDSSLPAVKATMQLRGSPSAKAIGERIRDARRRK
jgi:large repetitive protein